MYRKLGRGAYFIGTALLIAAIALNFLPVAAVSATADLKVIVCHATSSSTNPYVEVDVSIHSVDDATGLNGHGDHINDVWSSFVFDGVTYPGQNVNNVQLDEKCNVIVPTEVATATFTATATLVQPTSPSPEEVKVPICHATGSDTNPYVLVVVSVHSVDDATGLNGHGDHINDVWSSFVFDGVTYPGQNVNNVQLDENCNLVESTPTATEVPTVTATFVPPTEEAPTPTATVVIPTATATATLIPPTEEAPTPTATATIALEKLGLLAQCYTSDPSSFAQWEVTNSNGVAVSFEYSTSGGASGTGSVPANSSVIFTTPYVSASNVLSLYATGILQTTAKVAAGCVLPTGEPNPPSATDTPVVPITGGSGGPTVIIPNTGLDLGQAHRVVPETLLGFSFGFLGLGLVFSGIARKKDEKK